MNARREVALRDDILFGAPFLDDLSPEVDVRLLARELGGVGVGEPHEADGDVKDCRAVLDVELDALRGNAAFGRSKRHVAGGDEPLGFQVDVNLVGEQCEAVMAWYRQHHSLGWWIRTRQPEVILVAVELPVYGLQEIDEIVRSGLL